MYFNLSFKSFEEYLKVGLKHISWGTWQNKIYKVAYNTNKGLHNFTFNLHPVWYVYINFGT